MRYYITILLLALTTSCLFAQNPMGDKLFKQGMELQKTKTVAKQQQAIAKFKSAKVAYDSAEKKKNCDNAINTSNAIIKSLSNNNKTKKTRTESIQKTDEPVPTLVLSCNKLVFNNVSSPGKISILTNQKKWSAKIISKSTMNDFAVIKELYDTNELEITCVDNIGYKQREMVIEITAGRIKKNITIEQKGKPTNFYAGDTMIQISKKGGKKTVELYSNYNGAYDDNNAKNWHLISKPEWANVIPGEMKQKNLLKKITDAVTGKNLEEDAKPDIVTSIANIAILAIPKKSEEYEQGRKGEIILESGNKQITIVILQL